MSDLPNGRQALDELYWRAEILQAMYWMRGEGLARSVSGPDLARFLAVDEPIVADMLARLAETGYVQPVAPEAYALTPLGLDEGGRSFQDEFADYLRQAHGECGPGCWCKDPEHQGEPCPNRAPEDTHA